MSRLGKPTNTRKKIARTSARRGSRLMSKASPEVLVVVMTNASSRRTSAMSANRTSALVRLKLYLVKFQRSLLVRKKRTSISIFSLRSAANRFQRGWPSIPMERFFVHAGSHSERFCGVCQGEREARAAPPVIASWRRGREAIGLGGFEEEALHLNARAGFAKLRCQGDVNGAE